MLKILFIALLLTSCAVTRKSMDAMLGQSYGDMVAQYGPPDREDSDGHTGKVYVYGKRVYVSNMYGTIDKYRYTLFFVDRHDRIYRWIVREENVPVERLDVRVLIY